MRILIIEDDAILVKQLQKNLESQTFAVDIADKGERGSYLARVNDYDLILLDDSSSLQICNGFHL